MDPRDSVGLLELEPDSVKAAAVDDILVGSENGVSGSPVLERRAGACCSISTSGELLVPCPVPDEMLDDDDGPSLPRLELRRSSDDIA